MYICYIDETGNRDPRLRIPCKDGSVIDGDPLYVLTALCIFEQHWHTMEKTINRHKACLIDRIHRDTGISLTLADCEVKSNWLRQPRERAKRPFLKHLSSEELRGLTDVFYQQLERARATVFAVLMDKTQLPGGVTHDDIHLRSWERLLELIEQFMRGRHRKHQAIMVNDDVNQQANRTLAMSHARLLDKGTERGTWLRQICEMPMFVRSELSAGVQLADLCSYNIYRAFKQSDLGYPFFQRVAPFIWTRNLQVQRGRPFSGLWILDGQDSSLLPLVQRFESEQALIHRDQGLR